MSSFTEALVARKTIGRRWVVEHPFDFEVGELGSGEIIRVPSGFESNLASTPRFMWWLLPPDGDYSQACVLHDWLCIHRGVVGDRRYSVVEVSNIFKDALYALKVDPWCCEAMSRAVRWWGPRW